MSPKKALPALLGGLFMGVLSVLPIVGAANACCCLWVVVGGALAAWVMQQNHPLPISAGQGALVGLMAGAIGFGVMIVASIPVAFFQGTMMEGFSESLLRQEGVTPEMREILQQVGPGLILVTAAFVFFAAALVFGTLGGLIGAAIFRTAAPPLPVPPLPETAAWGPPAIPPPIDQPPPAVESDRRAEGPGSSAHPGAEAPGPRTEDDDR